MPRRWGDCRVDRWLSSHLTLKDFVQSKILSPLSPLFLTGKAKLDENSSKTEWKIHAWCFQGTSLKKSYFISCYFKLAFTSADIIFYNVLEPHSTFSEKQVFVTDFHFLMDSFNPPTPSSPPSTTHTHLTANFFVKAPLYS